MTEIPSTVNRRTRAIERALTETGAFIWMGGRTREGYTEHGAFGDKQAVVDAVGVLGWEGCTVVDGGSQYNRCSRTNVQTYWIRVPR
jgi:hypothetical protein